MLMLQSRHCMVLTVLVLTVLVLTLLVLTVLVLTVLVLTVLVLTVLVLTVRVLTVLVRKGKYQSPGPFQTNSSGPSETTRNYLSVCLSVRLTRPTPSRLIDCSASFSMKFCGIFWGVFEAIWGTFRGSIWDGFRD